MPLEKYKSMRFFDKTPEPAGVEYPAGGRLRFVVQKHAASHLHYDFRLEMEGVLKSWAVPKGPSMNPKDKRLAMMTEDHPKDYGSFEGIIPKGNYGAGNVIIWDEGFYEPDNSTGDSRDDERILVKDFNRGKLSFHMYGHRLKGKFTLVRAPARGDNAWLLMKYDDDSAEDFDVTKKTTSVKSGRTLEDVGETRPAQWLKSPDVPEAREESLPENLSPMLAATSEAAFDGPDWIYEIKWDGYRALAFLEDGTVKLVSRNKNDMTGKYPQLTEAFLAMRGFNAVFDGEILVLDEEGKSDFQALQQYLKTGSGPLHYYVFDLLHLNGKDLRELPLWRRKELLKALLPESNIIRYSDHVQEQGREFYKLAEAKMLEGIIAKRIESKYSAGKRTKDWLKIKTHMRQEAVIGGYTEPKGSRKDIGALILGVYENGKLVHIGQAGTGLPDALLKDLKKKLLPLARSTSPFESIPKINTETTWVEPKLVCEVKFSEWTKDSHMRHPVFLGLREDKDASSVVRENPFQEDESQFETADQPVHDPRNVLLKNPEKVFWPEEDYTKQDLYDYYSFIAPVIMPYLIGRPESLHRFPNGITGKSFYQKNYNQPLPEWVETEIIESDSEGRDLKYIVCNNTETLLYLVNLGCIEMNPWNSKVPSLEFPDWCVIDLDPEDIGFNAVVETAKVVHEILDRAGIPSYPKTSGATGMHIYIPMGAKYTDAEVRQFAEIIARLVHGRLPDITSVERMPAKRQQKIYLDFLQNRRGQTLASPYSVRPRPGATVSAPLDWAEVDKKLNPKNFTMRNMAKRLEKKGDLWQPVMGPGIDMAEALSRLGV